MTEDKIVEWHHWLNGHEFEQTPRDNEGQGSLTCHSPRGHKESDMTLWLNNSSGGNANLKERWPDICASRSKAVPSKKPNLNPTATGVLCLTPHLCAHCWPPLWAPSSGQHNLSSLCPRASPARGKRSPCDLLRGSQIPSGGASVGLHLWELKFEMGKRPEQTPHQVTYQWQTSMWKDKTTSHVIREMRTKATFWYHCIPNRTAKTQNTDDTKCWWVHGLPGTLITAGGNAKCCSRVGTYCDNFLENKDFLTIRFNSRAPWHLPKGVENWTEIFIAALMIVAQTGSKQNVLSKWINCSPSRQWNITQH